VLRTNIGLADLVDSVAAVDGGTISASSRLNVASNIFGTANGELMNGEGTALARPTASATKALATVDYVVANLQALTAVDAKAAATGALVDLSPAMPQQRPGWLGTARARRTP